MESVASHGRVFGAYLGITKLDRDRNQYALSSRPLGFSDLDGSSAGGHRAESLDEEDRWPWLGRLLSGELRPTLTGKQRLAPKKRNTFQLSLINGSEQTCMARVTKTNFELKIYSGSDRIWSTADCPSVIKPISRKLGSEHAVAWTLTWDGKRSKPDCRSAREAPRPGKYVATAQLEGAEPVTLRMILGT
jgi:hypothetical protein